MRFRLWNVVGESLSRAISRVLTVIILAGQQAALLSVHAWFIFPCSSSPPVLSVALFLLASRLRGPFQPLSGLDEVQDLLDHVHVGLLFLLHAVDILTVVSSFIRPCSHAVCVFAPSWRSGELAFISCRSPSWATEQNMPHRFCLTSTLAHLGFDRTDAKAVVVQATSTCPKLCQYTRLFLAETVEQFSCVLTGYVLVDVASVEVFLRGSYSLSGRPSTTSRRAAIAKRGRCGCCGCCGTQSFSVACRACVFALSSSSTPMCAGTQWNSIVHPYCLRTEFTASMILRSMS